jgi:hypothetical protein
MNTSKTIANVNTKVIDYIKKEIANKKERHVKMMQTVNPQIIQALKSMKKIGG